MTIARSRRRGRRGWALLCGLLPTVLGATCHPLSAQADASAEAPPGISDAERAALALKAEGRYAEAAKAFEALLAEDALRGDAQAAAEAEFHASMAQLLATRVGDVTIADRLSKLADGAFGEAHPSLRDRLLHLTMHLAWARGDRGTAASLTDRLGYLSSWWTIGPFDNERGVGYGRSLPPEKTWAADATYDGKKRPVQWRQLPIDVPPRGRVDLGAMMRPNEQVLAYASTCLHAERAIDVVLSLGTAGAFKVFLNGVEHAARDVSRAMHADQDAVAMTLRPGPNLLTLKVCTQDGGFAFAARLRNRDGSPLGAAVRASNDGNDLAAAADAVLAGEPTARPSWSPSRGALTRWRADDDALAPADAFRLAYLLALAQPDDVTARRDHRLALRVVAAAPDWNPGHYLLAFTRVRTAARAEEKDENPRRADYEGILARDSKHVEALRSLAELEYEGPENHIAAERLVRRALAVNPDFAAGLLLWADVLDSLGLDPLAEARVQDAARPDAAGRRNATAASRLFSMWNRHGRRAEAEALGRELLDVSFTPQLAAGVARLMMRRGARDEAIELLERCATIHPFVRTPHRTLARLFESEGDLPASLAAWQRWLEVCPEDDDAWLQIARVNGRLGNREAQTESLRVALDLNPNRKKERRYLEFLESDEKPFYDAYALDGDAILAADAGPPADAAEANDPYYYLVDQSVVRAYRNGTTSVYQHSIVRILNDAGVKDWGDYFVYHFWGEQRARLLELRVIKADGQTQRPKLSGYYAKLPPVSPGDTIEVRSRVDDLSPSFFGDYFGYVHQFSSDGVPTRRSMLTLIADTGREYRFQEANGAPAAAESTDADGNIVRQWEMRDVARLVSEEAQPDWKETLPLVRVTTYASWNQFAEWWWNLIRKQSEVSPEMRAKVAELTAGIDDELGRIKAIYEFVTTDVRYKAWEFGVHGYKPYSTSVVFERRHGDCKDKALLLNALLGELDIEAYPVLIWADEPRSNDDLSLAMVEHFNHCISYLPPTAERPGMFLDGTATYHPVDTPPTMDAGARVLVVKGPTGDVLDVPWTVPTTNFSSVDYTIELSAGGDATVLAVLEPSGNEAVWLRDFLGNEPAKRRENIERMFGTALGTVEVVEFEVTDMLDLDAPVRVQAKLRVPEYAPLAEGGLALRAQVDPESMQAMTSATERRYPLLLGVPRGERDVVRYKLPPGYTPKNLPEPVETTTPFGTFKSSWSFAGNELVVRRQLDMNASRIEVAEYPAFREFASQVDRADRQIVIAAPSQGGGGNR